MGSYAQDFTKKRVAWGMQVQQDVGRPKHKQVLTASQSSDGTSKDKNK